MDSLSGTWIPDAIYGLISIQRKIFAARGFCPAVLSIFAWCLPDWVVLSDFRGEFIK